MFVWRLLVNSTHYYVSHSYFSLFCLQFSQRIRTLSGIFNAYAAEKSLGEKFEIIQKEKEKSQATGLHDCERDYLALQKAPIHCDIINYRLYARKTYTHQEVYTNGLAWNFKD